VIAYLGPTHFAKGTWVGVELGEVNLCNHAGVIAYLGPTHFAQGLGTGRGLGEVNLYQINAFLSHFPI
jgi:hypothetical protein